MFVIPARHYVWIPAGVKHSLQIKHTAAMVRTLYFYTHDDHIDPFYTQIGIYSINNLLLEMIVFTESMCGKIRPASRDFHFVAAIKEILPKLSIRQLPITLPTTQHSRLGPVLQYLKTNAAGHLSLDTVSKIFGMSESTLFRLFKAVLKTTFIQYLKQMRMMLAIEMMMQTDLTMSEIAYEVGYNSLSSFSNTFYQLTQRRPSEFANHIR